MNTPTHTHTIHQFSIETDDLDLAGGLNQSLASYLGLQDLSVTASFPQQMNELSEVLEKIRFCASLGKR